MLKSVLLLAVAAILALAADAPAQSVLTSRPDDGRAVYFDPATFKCHPDGSADDSAALQQAVNNARNGILYVPPGRYRLDKTVFVPTGMRIVGYGKERPTFFIPPNTPAFHDAPTGVPANLASGHYMLHFAEGGGGGGGGRGGGGAGAAAAWPDATEFSFNCGVINVNFEIDEGNPFAIAIRFKTAQNSRIAYADFNLKSGLAAMEDIGNQANDIHVHGGKYGIISKKTSPAWQFLLMDSSFDGQTQAAIHTQEVGFTLIRTQFAHMPVAIEVPEGQVEQIYGRDLLLQDISKTAFVLGDMANFRSQTTLDNTLCSNVPHVLVAPEKIEGPGANYAIDQLTVGLDIGADGREAGIAVHHKEHALQAAPVPVASDVPALPPQDQWVNVRTLGVKADGSDDGPALQAAINAHPVLFFPLGTYRTSVPLVLKADSVLIGFHPGATTLAPTNSPAFNGADPTGVIVTKEGKPFITGLNVVPVGGGPRMNGILWTSPGGVMDDIQFAQGGAPGGGGRGPRGGGAGAAPADNAELWIASNGGGIFRGVWCHNPGTRQGLHIENTSTPSKVYQFSNEHHNAIETQYKNVQNWELYALQTEEENPAGANAIAADITDCQNLLFANTYMYRVSRNVLPKPFAVAVRSSDNIRFANMHVFSQTRLAFDSSVFNEDTGAAVRDREFTSFVIHKGDKAPDPLPMPAVFAKDAKLEKLATDFSNATSLVADDKGVIYFTDAARHLVCRYDPATKKSDTMNIGQNFQPMNLAYVAPSTLLVVAYEKAVFSVDLADPAFKITQLAEGDATKATQLILPTGLHNSLAQMLDLMQNRGYTFRNGSNTAIQAVIENEHRGYFFAPGTTVALPAGGTWRPVLQASQLTAYTRGETHLLTSEDDQRTFLATLDNDGKFSATKIFDRGGNAAITDADGNIYVAAGQVYVYDKQYKPLGVLEVPERPTSLLLTGADKKTLLIGARGAIYSIRLN